MTKKFIGHLPHHDPLHGYLQHDIQPQITGVSDRAKYRVYQMNASNDVYLYEDKFSGARVVGKFFLSDRKRNIEKAAHRLTNEFHNLCLMRDYGLTTSPHYVVRPLGCNYELNALLVVEYCEGELLSEIIQNAICQGNYDRLYRKLTALAYFLAQFHNQTAMDVTVDFNEDCAYMDRLTNRLLEINAISRDESHEFYGLRDQWRHKSNMWEDRQVMVHGDATPENFLFGRGLNVISFDLERTKRADRVFDTGRIAGELKHFFLRATGNPSAAEPFIGHFLWEYACHFPDRDRAFGAITSRVPFYLGITLLRISRNGWIDPAYRRELISEAKNSLRRF